MQAQTPCTNNITNIHKPIRPGSIHDGLRAASNTFIRPASARAAHAGLLQCATESNDYLPPYPTSTHATSTTGLCHPPLSRTLLSGAATSSSEPHGPQLSSVIRWPAKHAPTVQHHARPSRSHGYRSCVRAAELRLSNAADFDGWITTNGGHRGQKRANTTVTTAGAEFNGTSAIAGYTKSQDVPKSHGTCGQQPTRPERANSDDGSPASTDLCTTPDAATSTTPCGFSGGWPYGCRRSTTLCQREAVPSHSETTRGSSEIGRSTSAHLKGP